MKKLLIIIIINVISLVSQSPLAWAEESYKRNLATTTDERRVTFEKLASRVSESYVDSVKIGLTQYVSYDFSQALQNASRLVLRDKILNQ